MTKTTEAVVDPRDRQKAALAVLSTPVVQRMGLRQGRETRRRLRLAESFATLDGHGDDLFGWANETFKTRGVRGA